MSRSVLSIVGGGIAKVWSWIDAFRRFLLNFIFLILLIIVLVAMFSGGSKPTLQDKTQLVLSLDGRIVEQKASNFQQELAGLSGQRQSDGQVALRDVLAVIDAAGKDSKIQGIVLQLDGFQGAGMASLREVATALQAFKAKGKTIVAWGSGFDQRGYYLAAQANEAYIHPMGSVSVEGFGRYRNYYKEALDKLGVSANVLRVGTFKNAAEPYFASEPSKASLEAESTLFGGMWATYTEGVETARKLPKGHIDEVIKSLPERVKAAEGDIGKVVVDAKLVDGLKTRDEFREMMIAKGAKDSTGNTFRQVNFHDYLATLPPSLPFGDQIAVVVAEGEIQDGHAAAGTIGGESTSALIRKAREDQNVKAVVLRVNSPGGSAFASELIRRELELTRKAGKPVVVSMGDVAASGGYWISMSSDAVLADAATVTGSIGVFGMLPTADKAMDKLSIHTGGTHTTWLGGAYDWRRPLDPRFAAIVQSSIERIYRDFTTKAATARKTTPEKIDAVAQGRVWTGAQALEHGLIDRLGNFQDAVKEAAKLAKLPETAPLRYIEEDVSRWQKLMAHLRGEAQAMIGQQTAAQARALTGLPLQDAQLQEAQESLRWMLQARDARGQLVVHAHCMCQVN